MSLSWRIWATPHEGIYTELIINVLFSVENLHKSFYTIIKSTHIYYSTHNQKLDV